jgi:hypothetical protein
VLAAASLAVVAVVGVGGWGVAQLMSGGSSPASAIPGTAVGYVSLDLDPSASQKIEAIKMAKKFPGLDKQLDLGSRDDLRRWIFEQATKDSGCTDVDYDKDISPWIGQRIAVAAVPGTKNGKQGVFPLVALQADDEDAARAAVRKLDACGNDKGWVSDGPAPKTPHTGVAFVGDYLLLSDRQADVDAAAKAVEKGSLEDDPDFQAWMGRVGDPGVVTGYASAKAPALISKMQTQKDYGWGAYTPGGDATPPGSPFAKLGEVYKDFQGMAAVIRFHDGSLEAETVAKGLPAGMATGRQTGPDVRTLPASTAVAMSVGLPHGWLRGYLDSMNQMIGGGQSLDQMLAEGEAQTGLKLPQDIETLLGDGVSVSVDSSMDLDALQKSPDPSQVPVGLRIKGDPAQITRVIDKLKALAGPQADMVVVDKGDGVVAVGLQRRYVDQLLARGNLGSTSDFADAVPDADKAGSVLFVNFDAGDGWAEKLGDLASDHDPKVRQNIAPLRALGISSWQDDSGVTHGLLRLTTD